MLEIIDNLMNFFLNHALISLNTAPTPQHIFHMIREGERERERERERESVYFIDVMYNNLLFT